ncbi:MAG: thermonuclease family protein [Deltaproteobacteria bacterium]|nr:thermonuclease family protein [Deltaproteobacteria bacterium]
MLKKYIFLIIAASLFLSLSSGVTYYNVKYVYDGDTILLNKGGRVRYLGIDTPEIDHEGGKNEFMASAARKFNSKLVKGARVSLEFDKEKKDHYGRLLAYTFLENGDMVNALLVRNGFAHVMFNRLNLKYKELLLKCQQRAIEERLGIWSRPFNGEESFYLGDKRSFRFHRPDCPFGKRISKKNLLRFKSLHDAFWAGYSPCKRCRP